MVVFKRNDCGTYVFKFPGNINWIAFRILQLQFLFLYSINVEGKNLNCGR